MLRLWVCAGLLSGCLPWPHFDYHAAQVEGTLRGEQGALAQVVIRREVSGLRSSRGQCVGSIVAVTDEAGRFMLEADRQFSLFWIFGDPVQVWQVCFELPNGEPAIWNYMHMPGGRFLQVDCAVTEPKTVTCNELQHR